MSDFIEDLKYMCSSSNTSSRGFYLFVTAMLILIPLGAIASLVMMFVTGFTAAKIILFVVAVAIEAGVIVWLKRA